VTMNCKLLLLAVFFAVASAQSSCFKFHYKCVGQGATCDTNVTACDQSTSNPCRICSNGGVGACNGGTCLNVVGFKAACDSTHVCDDSLYGLTCLGSNVCGGKNVFFPGENCDGAGADNWVTSTGTATGGCAITKCDASSNKCAGAGSGQACSGNCTGGLYCDFTTDPANPVCASWKKSGSCTSAYEVAPSWDCVAGSVVKRFSQAAGANCVSDEDCTQESLCLGGKCTLVSNLGKACSTSADCDSNAECLCDYSTGNSACAAAVFEQNQINAYLGYLNCLESNNCGGPAPFPSPQNCAAANCLSQWKSLLNVGGSGNACSAASVIVSSFVLVLAAILVIIL